MFTNGLTLAVEVALWTYVGCTVYKLLDGIVYDYKQRIRERKWQVEMAEINKAQLVTLNPLVAEENKVVV